MSQVVQKLKKRKAKIFRKYYAGRTGFRNGSCIRPFRTMEESNECLRTLLESQTPFMLARHGSTELSYITKQKTNAFNDLCGISGFFPKDPQLAKKFRELYLESSANLDVLAVWNYRHGGFPMEEKIFREQSPGAELVDLSALTPFLFSQPWTASLESKSVLVIHPFCETIRNQYEKKRGKLFENSDVLPQFCDFHVLPAVQSMGGSHPEYDNWFEALEAMQEQIRQIDFDVALIGCGSYGLPLASFVKSIGKQGLHIGGALQLLFGIKGKRWEHPSYGYDKLFYNRYWVRPDDGEIVKNKEKFENGCYW